MPKVINITRLEAEAIQQLNPNECLISIYNCHESPWKLKVGGERVLQVQFDDVRAKMIHNGKQYHPISIDQAHEIISFIKRWEGSDFLVNCHAGIARSGAVALYMHICFGYELKPMYYLLSESNPMVLGTLISEHYKRKNKVYGKEDEFSF